MTDSNLLHSEEAKQNKAQSQDCANFLEHICIEGRYEGSQAIPEEEQDQTPGRNRCGHFALSFDVLVLTIQFGWFYPIQPVVTFGDT